MRRFLAGTTLLLLAGAAPGVAWSDCICRARGVVATHGQTVCIPTPSGRRLARCEKVSNVASWAFLDAPCPLASLDAATDRTVAALQQSVRAIR